VTLPATGSMSISKPNSGRSTLTLAGSDRRTRVWSTCTNRPGEGPGGARRAPVRHFKDASELYSTRDIGRPDSSPGPPRSNGPGTGTSPGKEPGHLMAVPDCVLAVRTPPINSASAQEGSSSTTETPHLLDATTWEHIVRISKIAYVLATLPCVN